MDSYGYYFWFLGTPPAAFVEMKDLIIFLFVGAALSIQFVKGIATRRLPIISELSWLVCLFVIACIYCLVDFRRAGNLEESIHGLRDFLMPMILLLIGFSVGARHNFRIQNFVNFLALIAVPVFLLSLFEFFFFQEKDLEHFGLIDQLRDLFIFIRADSNGAPLPGIRTFGVFDSPIGMALFCVTLIYNSFVGWGSSRPIVRVFHLGVGVLAGLSLLSTYTRTAVLGLILSVLLTFKFRARIYLLVAIPLIIAAGWVVLNGLFLDGDLEPSTAGHLFAYVKTYSFLLTNPWGYGSSFAGTRPGQVPLDGDYLNVILNFGPVGLGAFIYVYLRFFKKSKPSGSGSLIQVRLRHAARGGILSFLVLMVVLMVYSSAASWIFHLWLGLLLGVISQEDQGLYISDYRQLEVNDNPTPIAKQFGNA